ncbi:MAG: hypothetical protein AAGA80_19625 [Cyanobacteria bacterium P01_F01_bin.143]
MRKIFLCLCLVIFLFSCDNSQLRSLAASRIDPDSPTVIACFSGGREILRQEIVAGPFADEYKFAHEVIVRDETGVHSLNFSGGLCVIDRGAISVDRDLVLTDNLDCYSGANVIVSFAVYGRESTVDEYLEGRTFLAEARGKSLGSDSLHKYLVFGGGACIGNEIL